jgi:hypothetical protein
MYFFEPKTLVMENSTCHSNCLCIPFLGVDGTMRDTIIRRQRKHEAEQAISDLEKRGFRIVFPLTELSHAGKSFTTDSYNRKIFQQNTFSSCWAATMRREKQ